MALVLTHAFLRCIAAKPQYVKIENQNEQNDAYGNGTVNGTRIGPFNEGHVLSLLCISGGGKPVAKLDWYNSSNPLPSK